MRRLFYIFPVICALCASAALSGCAGAGAGSSNGYCRASGEIWHTLYNVTYRGPESLRDSILPVLKEVEESLSVFDSLSLVSKVNRSQCHPVNDHFKRVYDMSRKIHLASGGAFEPTLSPLITAWGFGRNHQATADTLRLDSLLSLTGILKTHLSGDTLYKDNPLTEFNFSAVAKGYGADCVAGMLRRNGVSDYMVEIGGEIVASGSGPHGPGWRIAISRPLPDSRDDDPHAVAAFTDGGMATSGNYRNFHDNGAVRYGHTISPVTGRPALTDVASVTVIAPSCMEADALATAAMTMGSAPAMAMLDSLDRPYLLIRTDLSTVVSDSFRPLLDPKSR